MHHPLSPTGVCHRTEQAGHWTASHTHTHTHTDRDRVEILSHTPCSHSLAHERRLVKEPVHAGESVTPARGRLCGGAPFVSIFIFNFNFIFAIIIIIINSARQIIRAFQFKLPSLPARRRSSFAAPLSAVGVCVVMRLRECLVSLVSLRECVCVSERAAGACLERREPPKLDPLLQNMYVHFL